MREGFTWLFRVVMFFSIFLHNKQKIASIIETYDSSVIDAESAVQASQLSGEMVLVGIVQMSNLLVLIVFWIMCELTIKEIVKRKDRNAKIKKINEMRLENSTKGDVVRESN